MMILFRHTKQKKSLAVLAAIVSFSLGAYANNPEKSPLASAAERGDLSGVQQLIQQGSDVNARDSKGLDALSYAVINDRPDTVLFLLKHGANANTADDTGITALIISATVGDNEIVKILHDHGANVNQANHDGITPLMAAAGSNNKSTIALLLSYGADACIRDKNNLTALQTAEQWRGELETSRAIDAKKLPAALICH